MPPWGWPKNRPSLTTRLVGSDCRRDDPPPIRIWVCICGRDHDPVRGFLPPPSESDCFRRRPFFLLESGLFDEPSIIGEWPQLVGLRLG